MGGLEAIVIVGGGDKVLLGKCFSLLSKKEYCVTQNKHACSVVYMNNHSVCSDKEGGPFHYSCGTQSAICAGAFICS